MFADITMFWARLILGLAVRPKNINCITINLISSLRDLIRKVVIANYRYE